MLRKFLADGVVYAIPAFISRGLSLFLVPLYTRVLSPADYGSLDLLMIFAGIVNLTITLEVSQGVARYYAEEVSPESKVLYASSAFWFTLFCYSVFAFLMLCFTSEIYHWIMARPNLENAFRIGVAYIWSGGLFYLVQNQLRWELRSQNYAIASLLMTFVTAATSVWFAYGLRWGLEGILLGSLAGNLAGLAIGLWWLRKSIRLRFKAAYLRAMLVFSTPLVLSGMAVWVSLYVDRLMIKHFLSVNEVGLYGIGHRLASIASLAMIGFQSALTPLIYKHYREPDTPHQLARIFRLFSVFSITLFLGLSLFAVDILRLLTTEVFYEGAGVVTYLVPAILLANMYIFAPGIGIAKKTHWLVWINIGGALLNASMNYFFIPNFGIQGAAISTLISSLVIFICHMGISQYFYKVPHRWRSLVFTVIFSMTIALVLPALSLDDALRRSLSVLGILAVLGSTCFSGLFPRAELRRGVAEVKALLNSSSYR